MPYNSYETKIFPKRVIILGGTGFIGKKITTFLSKKDIECVSYSSRQMNLILEQSSDSLAKFLNYDDTLIFLSALTPDKEKGIMAFEKNMKMASTVFKALEKKSINHFIYFSSDAVYSMEQSIISEKTLLNPQDLYGLMHMTREKLFSLSFNNILIFRPTLVYGIGDTHNSYGPNRFLRSAFENREIKLFGNGEETRDHILIDNLLELLLNCILYRTLGNLNAVTGNSISYMELAHKVNTLFKKELKILSSERKNLITYRKFDNSNIYHLFPKFSFTSLENGLYSYYNQMMERTQ